MPKTRSDGATDRLKKVWAEHVRAAMDKRGLSGREVAQALDVGPQTVSNWRAGRSVPSVQNLVDFSTLVREPISWLIGDHLHGRDSIDALGKQLALRLGHARLAELKRLSDRELLDALDLLIGRHRVAGRKSAARKAAK